MRDLAILTFVTLDGVMQAPGQPDEEFSQGGWAQPYWDEVMEQVRREAMTEPYDMLFGRTTYDSFASAFSEDSAMTRATKYVASSSPVSDAWANTVPLTGDAVAAITELKTQDGPLLQVHGSWGLLQTLLANQLIDEYRLWTFPVVTGAGKRLFDNGLLPASLKLVKTQPTASGVVMTIYRRDRES